MAFALTTAWYAVVYTTIMARHTLVAGISSFANVKIINSRKHGTTSHNSAPISMQKLHFVTAQLVLTSSLRLQTKNTEKSK